MRSILNRVTDLALPIKNVISLMQVMIVLFDEAGMELATFLFNGTGSNNSDWFSKERLLSSPYDDIESLTPNYFSMEG